MPGKRITIIPRIHGKLTRDHFYSLTVAVNLASDLAALGDATAARTLGEDTLERLRSLMGEDHFLTLNCAANLVADLRATGANDEAEHLLAETLIHYADTLGKDHSETQATAAGQRIDADFDPPPI